jgi:hypothetical protein
MFKKLSSDIRHATSLGDRFGFYYFVVYAISAPLLVLGLFKTNILIESGTILFGTVANILFLCIVIGLIAIAEEKMDTKFAKNLKVLFVLTLIMTIIGAVFPFLGQSDSAIAVTALILILIVTFIIGVVRIRLATNLESLVGEYGDIAHRAGYWSKVSGWLTVSIILLPLGSLLWVMSNYYEWRIVQERTKK